MNEAGILVVDDDAEIRSLVVEILRLEGYRVESAGDGAEALRVLERYSPSVILLDMRMPVLNGWQFADAMRKQGLQSKLVVMSAGRDTASWAAEIGADGVLTKPFALDDLLTTVATYCDPPA